MKRNIFVILGTLILAMVMSGCGRIETGNVGIRKNFDGTISETIVGTGWYSSVLSGVEEYTTKEIAINLENMTPKASDNLSLKDLDVTVRYRAVDPAAVRSLVVTKFNASIKDDAIWLPGYTIVKSASLSQLGTIVSGMESMTVHAKRDQLEAAARASIQKTLDESDPNKFIITQIIVRDVTTDNTIEESIRTVVAKGKELEAAKLSVAIAEKNAEATAKTAATLTPSFLQHEYNQVLMTFAKTGGNTLVLDGSSSSKILQLGK